MFVHKIASKSEKAVFKIFELMKIFINIKHYAIMDLPEPPFYP